MRLRRCAQGISLLVILLLVWAFIIDSMAILLAGSTLLFALAALALSFDNRFRQMVASLMAKRTLERTMVRKGATVRVTTQIAVQVPAHMEVKIAENLPSGLVVQDGETGTVFEAVPAAPPQRQERKVTYRVTPVVHGSMHVSGVSLIARDLFFENSIDLSSEPFRGPVLFVQPRGLFEPSSQRVTAETREIEKMSVLSGFGIRALREYYTGDDLRRIDWKLTAKHDKLFVREYSGVMSLPPLIIVDLPWRRAPHSAQDFDRMVAAVAGMAEYSVKMFQYVSVLLISGPNILQYMGEEKDLQRCMSVLREWMHPVERTVHFYRMPDRSDLRRQIRTLESRLEEARDPSSQKFFDSLNKQYLRSLQAQQIPAFTAQLVRTLSPLMADECYVFSLFSGDASHLRQVIRQAKAMKIRVHVRMPGTAGSSAGPEYQSRLGADTFEAFA